eukprot:m.92940 g.92940  ORF g.92940 m.92940 type:complete len:53 (-) comp16526_c0_seq4:760-918(-)
MEGASLQIEAIAFGSDLKNSHGNAFGSDMKHASGNAFVLRLCFFQLQKSQHN